MNANMTKRLKILNQDKISSNLKYSPKMPKNLQKSELL